jgi:hypothetical protein
VTGGDFGPEAGIIGILSRFVVIALLVGYLTLRYRDGSFAQLRYAPDPQKRRPKAPSAEQPAAQH